MAEKVFTTIKEQIELLKSRGISITSDSDYAFAYRILTKCGYYNLINGYSALFIDSKDKK